MAAKTPDEMRQALEKLATHMANESKRADVSWGKIADAIEKSSKEMQLGWSGALGKLTGSAPIVQRIATTLTSGFRGSKDSLDAMMESYTKMYQARERMHDPTAARQSAAYHALTRQLKAGTTEIEAHRKLWTVVGETMTSKTGGAVLALIGSFKVALNYSHQINDALRQGNSSLAARSKLIQQISNVQAETGNEMADMAKAASVLTEYGFDLRNGFRDTLATVVKMEEGLGVSYESSAQLAVMSKNIGSNFQRVADSVARVKTDTALAAEEAVKFATQISKAVMMLKPGSGSLVDQTSEYTNRLAGALKELTGSGQGIVDMLSSFTTEQGMMGAATLGATPDFLASPEQTKKVTENFVRYVNRQLSGTSGFQRMATIQLLAEQFNTTADVIANAQKMMDRYNDTQKTATSLQEQWRQQTSEIGKTLSKVYESGKAVIQQVLLPVLQNLRPALATVADIMGSIAKNAWAVRVAGVVLIGSAIAATIAFTRLAIALGQAALASSLYQRTLGKDGGFSITDLFTKRGAGNFAKMLRTDIFTGKAVPVSAASGITRTVSSAITTWLPRIGGWLSTATTWLSRMAGPVAAVAAAAVAGWVVGRMIDRGLKKMGYDLSLLVLNTSKDSFRAQQLAYSSNGQTRSEILSRVKDMAASGASTEEIQKYILRSASFAKGLHGEALTKERREKILMSILQDAGREITRQRVRVGYTSLTEQSASDKAHDAQMIELFKAVAMNTQLANDLLKKAESKHEIIEGAKRRDREDYEAEQRLRRQSNDRQMDIIRQSGVTPGPKF